LLLISCYRISIRRGNRCRASRQVRNRAGLWQRSSRNNSETQKRHGDTSEYGHGDFPFKMLGWQKML